MFEAMVKQMRKIDDVKRAMLGKMRALREANKYSQEYVAAELGINQNTYSKIESGQTELTLKRVLQLCAVYGEDPGEFFEAVLGDSKIENTKPANAEVQGQALQLQLDKLLAEVLTIGKWLRAARKRIEA